MLAGNLADGERHGQGEDAGQDEGACQCEHPPAPEGHHRAQEHDLLGHHRHELGLGMTLGHDREQRQEQEVHQQDRVPAEVRLADEPGQLANGVDVGQHGRTVAGPAGTGEGSRAGYAGETA